MRKAALLLSPVSLLLLCPLTACRDDRWVRDYTYVWKGDHVTLYGYDVDDSDACDGSFVELDGHTELILEDLGLQDAPPYVYRWFSEDFWDEVDPCEGAFACALDGVAMARVVPQMHEAVHALINPLQCPLLLEEGLAMVYDVPTPTWTLYPSSEYELADLLARDDVPRDGNAYVRAAHFVAFVIENYGARAVADLCRELPREPSRQQWAAAVASVLDAELEQLLAEYEQYPRCNYQQMRSRLWGCAKHDLTFAGGELVVTADCTDPQATNAAWSDASWGDYGDALLLRRVHFPNDTWADVSARAEGPSGAAATYVTQECAPCSEAPLVNRAISEGGDLQFFPAGLHEVSVYFDRADAVVLTITAVE